VVTGIGVTCSISADVDSFAAALRQGRAGIEPNPWGEEGPPFGALIRGFALQASLARRRTLAEELLQAAEQIVRRSSFPIQVATTTALEAWETARLHEAPIPGERLGLIVAGNNLTGNYADTFRASFEQNPRYLPGRFALQFLDTDHIGTLSEVLGIRGDGFTAGGASASGNIGIINGSRLVESGAVDACLVVGALAELSTMEMQGFLNIGAIACRIGDGPQETGPPFDSSSRGFVPGQGCACLVLESNSSASRRGVTPLARVGAYAVRLDANRLANPSEQGEASVMANAIQEAGLEPHQVAYVNTHGSGSSLGDETEVNALRRVFGNAFGVPWVNSTKSLTGHCLTSAGVLEAAATVIQMQENFVHPNVGMKQPIDLECRFVGAQAEKATIPFALSNSFGFGGINTSILLIHPDARR
jgi:malonyl-ACP decarboxylase